MYAGQYVFAQLMEHLPWHVFRRCVARYNGRGTLPEARQVGCRGEIALHSMARRDIAAHATATYSLRTTPTRARVRPEIRDAIYADLCAYT